MSVSFLFLFNLSQHRLTRNFTSSSIPLIAVVAIDGNELKAKRKITYNIKISKQITFSFKI